MTDNNQVPENDAAQRRAVNLLADRFTAAAIEAEKILQPDLVPLALLTAGTNRALQHQPAQLVADLLRGIAAQIEASIAIEAARKPH